MAKEMGPIIAATKKNSQTIDTLTGFYNKIPDKSGDENDCESHRLPIDRDRAWLFYILSYRLVLIHLKKHL